MESFFQFFGKFPSLIVASFIVLIVANLILRGLMRQEGKDPNFELNALGPLIFAAIISVIFFVVSMFYGPFSFLGFK